MIELYVTQLHLFRERVDAAEKRYVLLKRQVAAAERRSPERTFKLLPLLLRLENNLTHQRHLLAELSLAIEKEQREHDQRTAVPGVAAPDPARG